MKNSIFTIALLIVSNLAIAQTVEVISKSDYQPEKQSDDFNFIEPTTDTTEIKFVATIKASAKDKKTDISELYHKIEAQANKLGANAFKLLSYTETDSSNNSVLILNTYYGTDTALSSNFRNHEKNVIYIFGAGEKTERIYSFKIDNTKAQIKGGTFYKQAIKEGQIIKVSKGGITGAAVWIKGEENKRANFLTLSGFGLGGGPVPPGVMGASFNTGRINFVNGNLGHLLVTLLTPGN